MSRLPFDPMNTAAMQAARARKFVPGNQDVPPLPIAEERALIEAAALAGQIAAEDMVLAGGTASRPLSVKQANSLVSSTLAATLPPTFFIQGEISNFRTYDRGHAFFTLKESGAELPCVLWKDSLSRLKFRPKDGLAVIARGAVKVYEPQGKLQLYVEALFPQGAGALELAFRQLCDKLKAEGLFEQARKRPIPRVLQRIVVITSRTGDVLHDVLTTAFRRFPGLHVLLLPVRVQGEQAAAEIIRAIAALNAACQAAGERFPVLPPVDLILLVRGGGSLEDLWPFNDEGLARAICASIIPIATGIGHEPDTTIADLVGDLRGATPTAITELTIPDVRTLLQDLLAKCALLTRDMRRAVEHPRACLERTAIELESAGTESVRSRLARLEVLARKVAAIEPRHAIAQGWRRAEEAERGLAGSVMRRLAGSSEQFVRLQHRLERATPSVEKPRFRVNELALRLDSALAARRAGAVQRLAGLETHLRAISPQSVLERGFSITSDAAGNLVRTPEQVRKGDLLKTRLAAGEIISTVGKPKQATLF